MRFRADRVQAGPALYRRRHLLQLHDGALTILAQWDVEGGTPTPAPDRRQPAHPAAVADQPAANDHRRVDSATVVAPVSGLIQSLPNPRAGQVVAPGEVVAEIVPSDEGLLFEARHLGQKEGRLEFSEAEIGTF